FKHPEKRACNARGRATRGACPLWGWGQHFCRARETVGGGPTLNPPGRTMQGPAWLGLSHLSHVSAARVTARMPIVIRFLTRVTPVTPVTGGFGGRQQAIVSVTKNFNHLIPMGSSCSIASSLVASASFIQRWTGCTRVEHHDSNYSRHSPRNGDRNRSASKYRLLHAGCRPSIGQGHGQLRRSRHLSLLLRRQVGKSGHDSHVLSVRVGWPRPPRKRHDRYSDLRGVG